MNKSLKKTLFIFRRDLRLEDNTGLIYALTHSEEVIPCFIFTPTQIDSNPYLGSHSLQFMIESLEDVEKQLEAKGGKLYLFYEEPEEVIKKCILELGIDGVIFNRDYTPYSLQRDEKIKALCKKENLFFQSFHDALLHPPEETLKKDEKPYAVFTPFYRNSSKLPVKAPEKNRHHNYYTAPIKFEVSSNVYHKILPKRELPSIGGRSHGLALLKKIHLFGEYELERNFPEKNGTTHLSAHLKFTTLSPREVYQAILDQLGPSSELIRSLYWRDFFTTISFYFPYVFKGAFHEKYNEIPWNRDTKAFQRWCEGKTGFPIVDAGMRELNQTGFMHNRARMIVGSFLVKDLHIDWRWGEKYFAQKLSDYDPAVNNGNWQWVASTGCDAQPYFRIFNPWTQGLKFDPECTYIKKWIPELSNFTPKKIHNWNEAFDPSSSYPAPIIDHSEESKKAIGLYRI